MKALKEEKGIFENFFKKDAIGFQKIINNGLPPGKTIKRPVTKLPFLPNPEQADEGELSAYWRTLRAFFRTGLGGGISSHKSPVYPLLMSPYRNQEYIRIGYPFWMADGATPETAPKSSSLGDLLVTAIQSFAPEDNQARILKDNVLRIELNVSNKLPKQGPTPFQPVVQEAIKELEDFLAIPGEEGKSFKSDLTKLLEHLPKSGVLISFSKETPFLILAQAIGVHFSTTKKDLIHEIELLRAKLKDVLSVERDKSPEGKNPETLKSSFDIAGAFMNYVELAAVLPESGSEIMPEDRQKRIKKVLKLLENAEKIFSEKDAVILVPRDLKNDKTFDWEAYFPNCRIKAFEKGGCTEALKAFDEHMQGLAKIIGAVRIGQLEIKDQFSPELHGDYFAHFDWRSFSPGEMKACPLIILIETVQTLMGVELTDFSRLLASNKPIKTLAIKQEARMQLFRNSSKEADEFVFQQELAGLAISHRNTYVLQSTPITPDHLFQGFSTGVSSFCPALFYVLSSSDTPRSTDPYMWTSAAVEGRYFPSLSYDHLKGSQWGSRFDIKNNPQPEVEWPIYDLKVMGEEEESTLTIPFTFADFAAQDSKFQRQFLIVPSQYWTDDLVPLSEFLSFTSEEVYSKVPFIWMVNDDNQIQKVAVTWSMTLFCQERLDFWHFIQENCGVKSYHVEQAIERIRTEMEQQNADQIATLEEAHAKEIEEVKEKSAGEAMERLTAILLDLDTVSAAPSPQISPPPQSDESIKQASPPEEAPDEAVTEEREEEDLSLGDPWIETVLCTTCNECTDINNRMFSYNGDKQAYIADPKAGTFEELVLAAENCPPKIIHPGAPLNANEQGLEEFIKRAEPFN